MRLDGADADERGVVRERRLWRWGRGHGDVRTELPGRELRGGPGVRRGAQHLLAFGARAFGATHTPEAYLFDAAGKLVYHGGVDDNAHDEQAVKEHWLQDAVAAVAAGKPVAMAETKALGCSVKLRAKAGALTD